MYTGNNTFNITYTLTAPRGKVLLAVACEAMARPIVRWDRDMDSFIKGQGLKDGQQRSTEDKIRIAVKEVTSHRLC